MNEIEYIINSAVWSVGGFILGWFASVRWRNLERRVEHIEHVVEETHDDPHRP